MLLVVCCGFIAFDALANVSVFGFAFNHAARVVWSTGHLSAAASSVGDILFALICHVLQGSGRS